MEAYNIGVGESGRKKGVGESERKKGYRKP